MHKIDPIIVHLSSHLQGEAGEIITGFFFCLRPNVRGNKLRTRVQCVSTFFFPLSSELVLNLLFVALNIIFILKTSELSEMRPLYGRKAH